REVDLYFRSFLLADLSHPARALGLNELARLLAIEAATCARAWGAPYPEARASLLVALADGEPSQDFDCASWLETALELTERHKLAELWTRKERSHAGPPLVRALVEALGPAGTAERLAIECGGQVLEEVLGGITDAPAAVRYRMAAAAAGARDLETR